ncbi:MAG: dTDP-glucose 4,6-dehydratase, partial [Chloroflexi bacterium]|nr:dTDP-glucose 4,6-dehydratase [Chloroflexota bacterium]
DWTKLAGLGWQPRHSLDDTFRLTVSWYVEHPEWWRAIKSGEFAQYYERWYGQRLA